METLSHEEKIEASTLKFLQRIQQTLGSARNGKLGAYYRWHQQNILDHADERLGITAQHCNGNNANNNDSPYGSQNSKGNQARAGRDTVASVNSGKCAITIRRQQQQRRKRPPNVDSLCEHCLTPFAHLRIVPKKSQFHRKGTKKPIKRGTNYQQTLVTAKCANCESKFKFTGFQTEKEARIRKTKAVFRKEKKVKKTPKIDKDKEKQPQKSLTPLRTTTKPSTTTNTPTTSKSFQSPLLTNNNKASNQRFKSGFKSPFVSAKKTEEDSSATSNNSPSLPSTTSKTPSSLSSTSSPLTPGIRKSVGLSRNKNPSQKEFLQKLLGDSKNNKNNKKDSTGLGSFLNNCFN